MFYACDGDTKAAFINVVCWWIGCGRRHTQGDALNVMQQNMGSSLSEPTEWRAVERRNWPLQHIQTHWKRNTGGFWRCEGVQCVLG